MKITNGGGGEVGLLQRIRTKKRVSLQNNGSCPEAKTCFCTKLLKDLSKVGSKSSIRAVEVAPEIFEKKTYYTQSPVKK